MRNVINLTVFAICLLSFCDWSSAASLNGRAGEEPAFYDDELFTINLKEFGPKATRKLLRHNSNFNIIYESEGFVDVIDAVPGDGFNPLWLEVEIEFSAGVTPFQFTSDEEIEDAADAGLITLTDTRELYRCSVIGPKQ